ncbi:hypothetical protein BJY01DRAFT_253764 [Aspergillus pseudoustus]|uniref:Uncharacterized protein n=1 Tax=Aspergillus pseudoustus TaxID=1810923 RepID=A0ABR4IYV8_9EURO
MARHNQGIYESNGAQGNNRNARVFRNKILDEAQIHEVRSKGTASSSSKRSNILDTWFYEILATVFSVGCFVSIVGILAAFDGKPTPTFAYSLTLNTVISILATASKASLIFMISECTGQLKWLWFYKGGDRKPLNGMQLFDSASRGPLGALMVLFQHKGGSLVSLGALIMLLSTPYDAFVQQILTYPIRNTIIATDSPAAPAQRATSLLLPLLGDDEEDIVQIGQWSDDFTVAPSCPSGNCTWPVYNSVEMCSQCEDITNTTYVTCPSFPVNTTLPEFDGVTQTCRVQSLRGYGPSKLTLLDNTNGSFYIDMAEEVIWSQTLAAWADSDLPYPAAAVVHAQIAVADPDQYLHGYPAGLDIGTIFTVTKATECTLRLCQQAYNMTVSSGSISLEKGEPNYGAQFWVDKRNGTALPGKHPEWDLGSAFVRANHSTCWRPEDGPAVQLTPNTNTTWVNEAESAFCPVSEFVAAQYLEGQKRVQYISLTGQIWPELNTDPQIKRIRTVGLEESMRRIAASYTKRALMATNTTVSGTIYNAEVYVSVEWWWIILPAALTVLGLVFLGATIFMNHRRGLKLWKTSILAVLYHGLTRFRADDGDVYQEVRDEDDDAHATVSRMEKMARGVRVRLAPVDEKKGLMLD